MSKDHITLYTTSWCPHCVRLKNSLDRSGTPYTNIDVEQDEAAAEWVKSVNNGNRVVPTVEYSDGTHATNPPAADVRQKLAELSG
ncbi:mycoredoxin [Corynebacterium freiburgense]|uniref:mycoredoxin n=1 Tax=Corynebacterium freiburgense TaxID=556548 RepID=UPI00040C19BA|nr:mycoredoxin [Corynebacterium freiburgense]WJZ02044.1 Mycoredoxin 1 [Corynebacterium freiburgense]